MDVSPAWRLVNGHTSKYYWQHKTGWWQVETPDEQVQRATAEAAAPTIAEDINQMKIKIELLKAQVQDISPMQVRIEQLEKEVAHGKDLLARLAAEGTAAGTPSGGAAGTPCVFHGEGQVAEKVTKAIGSHEKSCYSWTQHLESTLFSEKDVVAVHKLYDHLAPDWDKFKVTACRTQANRFFHVQCKTCNRFVFGKYGKDDEDAAQDEACRTLMQFVLLGSELSETPQVCHVRYKESIEPP